jgi:hypothetical protein
MVGLRVLIFEDSYNRSTSTTASASASDLGVIVAAVVGETSWASLLQRSFQSLCLLCLYHWLLCVGRALSFLLDSALAAAYLGTYLLELKLEVSV